MDILTGYQKKLLNRLVNNVRVQEQRQLYELKDPPSYKVGDKVQFDPHFEPDPDYTPEDIKYLQKGKGTGGTVLAVYVRPSAGSLVYKVDFGKNALNIPHDYRGNQRRYLYIKQHDLGEDSVCYMQNKKCKKGDSAK